jgi:hypothetical protein
LAVLAPIPREPRLVEQGIEYLGRWFMRPAQAGRWTSASGVRRDFTSVRRTYHTLHVSCSCQRSSDFHNPIYSKSLAICGCKPEFPISTLSLHRQSTKYKSVWMNASNGIDQKPGSREVHTVSCIFDA